MMYLAEEMRRLRTLVENTGVPYPSTATMSAATDHLKEINDGSETLMTDFGYEVDTDGMSREEIEQEFADWFDNWASNALWDAWSRISFCFSGNTIRVYREITAPPDWKPDPNRHPGQYWSWDEHAAEAHWGSFNGGTVKWTLVADLTADEIDWPATLAQNAHPDYESEKEIRVRDGVPVELVAHYRSR